MAKITKDMLIAEVARKYPETVEVFFSHGLHCIGCAAAAFETVEEGAAIHEIDVGKLVKELNEVVKKNGKDKD